MDTYIYDYNKYPYKLIGPAMILWHAYASDSDPMPNPAKTSKGKGKEKATVSSDESKQRTRVVWLRVHPSVTEQAHEALRVSASFALDSAKQTGRVAEVEIADLREHLNVFEIMGPKSSQVIKGALRPVDDDRANFKKV